MSRSRRQLRVRNPNVLLLLPLLARPHCHTRILRTTPVDTSTFFAYVSRLTPQAARVGAVIGLRHIATSLQAVNRSLYGPGSAVSTSCGGFPRGWHRSVRKLRKSVARPRASCTKPSTTASL